MMREPFELENCIVLVGPELRPFACRRFVCEDGLITKIEREEERKSLEGGCPIVVPGMWNSHTHMGDSFIADGATDLTLEEGFFRPDGLKYRELETVDSEFQYAAVHAALEHMATTGTVGHIDFREQGTKGAKLLRKASGATGITSIILGQLAQLPFSGAELSANTGRPSKPVWEEIRAILRTADGVSESTINDLTDPTWRELLKLSEAEGKLRAIHCLENTTYREESLRITGRGDLERALDVFRPHLVIHLTVANEEEIALLKASGAVAVVNPRANAALGLPLPPLKALLEADVPLLLGTDNGLLNSPNLLPELDFTYRLAKSQYGNAVDPPPEKILAMATSNIRHVPGERFLGHLEEGLPGSFFVVDGHAGHLRYSRNLLAALLTRATPEDILWSFNRGRCLLARPTSSP